MPYPAHDPELDVNGPFDKKSSSDSGKIFIDFFL